MTRKAALMVGGVAYIGLAVVLSPVEAGVRAIQGIHGIHGRALDKLVEETNDLIEEMQNAYSAR